MATTILYVAGHIDFIGAGPQMLGKDGILDVVNMLAEFTVGSRRSQREQPAYDRVSLLLR